MIKPFSIILPALCLLFLFLLSCQQAKTEEKVPEKVTKPTLSYPALSNQDITQLYASAEKLDMIFYDLPLSVNQDDSASDKNSVLYVSPAPVQIHSSCKPLGRLSWISQGAIYKEADIYMDSVCQYFLFMVNNQPVAANAISEAGIQFFTKIIAQVPTKSK